MSITDVKQPEPCDQEWPHEEHWWNLRASGLHRPGLKP